MIDLYLCLAVAVMALVTALLRFLPFIVFSEKRRPPAIIDKLASRLPYAVMGMLVVYCLKDTTIMDPARLIPTVAACAVVVISYLWKRNTLISIVGGTVCYMLLLQAEIF